VVHPLTPALYRVVSRRQETGDVVTLSIDGPPIDFLAGQFNMLTAFGVGEVPISISSPPRISKTLEHTIRDVGPVTHALCSLQVGSVIGVRGPFGTDWGVDAIADRDVVVVAGGIGLAPLRGALMQLAVEPGRARRVTLAVGARSPGQIIFGADLEQWRRAGIRVETTVDIADQHWTGHVGVVTTVLEEARFDPAVTTALICGPEIMIRLTARALHDRGVGSDHIWVSLERNMQCGVALCGHCQLGPLLLCRDGPVLPYTTEVVRVMSERER
jgi:anaerobic sulfite reductase subunit B